MRILLILTSIEIGTIEKVSYNLYKTFSAQKNLEIYVVNLKSSNKDFYKFENLYNIPECTSNNFFIRQVYNLRKIFKLYKIKAKVKPDVSITTQEAGTTINLLSLGAERKIGIFHAPYYQAKAQGRLSFYLQFLSYRYLYSKLDRLCCVSMEVKNSITKSFLSIDESKLRVVYNVHNFTEIKEKSEELLDSNEDFLFKSKVIIYIGRFDENKAPDRLIRSFYQLRYEGKIERETKLLFIGEGEKSYTDYLQDLMIEFKLTDSIVFLGYKANPYKYLKRSTILVSSSFSEGLPGVVIEALFLKIPVIATNSSIGLWEIFDCVKEYNDNLSGIHIANNGIITPNVINNEELNLEGLNTAVEKLLADEKFYQETRNSDFGFLKQLDEQYIIENFTKY